MSAPKEIDRDDVLGELRHRWYGDGDPADMIRWVLDELVELDILRYREPADDPSEDPIGTVRQCPDADAVAVRTEWCHEHESGCYRWRVPATGGARPTSILVNDEHVSGWPVIGAVPGTPAAEQHHEPVPPDGPSGQPFPPLPDPHVPVVLKRADTAPPISSYSRHQQHTERHLDCEYCMRRGDQS